MPRQHVMDGFLQFAKTLNINPKDLRWDIPISKNDRDFALNHTSGSKPILVISPCTGERFRNFRNWKASHYSKIADFADSQYGAKIILTGGNTETEKKYGEKISLNCQGNVTNLIGKTTLKQLLALLERATVLLCPDSGPAHMATAAGTPVIGLYATSNTNRTGPYKSQHLIVDKYPEAVQQEFNARVSEIKWGKRVRNPHAMDLITVPDVMEKLSKAFEEAGIKTLST